jgi:putative oxidoreductase
VMAEPTHWIFVAGRALMAGFYIVAGVHHFLDLDPLTQLIAARQVPAPKFVLIAGSLFQIGVGILLMIGICQAQAAMALIFFTLIASVMLLNFWSSVGDQRRTAITQWQCNLALIGGLLAMAAGNA